MKIACFWLQWVLATFTSFLVSLYWIEIDIKPHVGVVEGVIGGVAIGIAQGLVLQQGLKTTGWWILASAIAWGLLGTSNLGSIGWIAPNTLHLAPRVIAGIFVGAQAGVIIGVGQWFVLRQQAKRASLWILANAASWAIGLAVGWAAGGVLRQATHLFLSELVGLAVVWLIVATITGFVLVWLLHSRVTDNEKTANGSK
jgi:MFS family permease